MEARVRLTTKCNLNCEYCFAREFRSTNYGDISPENVQILIEAFHLAGIKRVKIQGGEPTVHSRFPMVSKLLSQSGLELDLFTNGLYNPELAKSIKENYNSITINCNEVSQKKQNTIAKNIRDLVDNQCAVMLGKTISQSSCGISEFLDFCDPFKESVRIRLDICRPGSYSPTGFDDFCVNTKLLTDAILMARYRGFEIEVDCCYPPCAFTQSEWKLVRKYLRGFWSKCSTIVDILPNLQISSCFCGSQISSLFISDFSSLLEAQYFVEYIENQMRFDTTSAAKCEDCLFRKSKACQGGCLGHKKTTLRTAGKAKLDEFRDYFSAIQHGTPEEVVGSIFSIPTILTLLNRKNDARHHLQQYCGYVIAQEKENPFVYINIASSLVANNQIELAEDILAMMPQSDIEANRLKDRITNTVEVKNYDTNVSSDK